MFTQEEQFLQMTPSGAVISATRTQMMNIIAYPQSHGPRNINFDDGVQLEGLMMLDQEVNRRSGYCPCGVSNNICHCSVSMQDLDNENLTHLVDKNNSHDPMHFGNTQLEAALSDGYYCSCGAPRNTCCCSDSVQNMSIGNVISPHLVNRNNPLNTINLYNMRNNLYLEEARNERCHCSCGMPDNMCNCSVNMRNDMFIENAVSPYSVDRTNSLNPTSAYNLLPSVNSFDYGNLVPYQYRNKNFCSENTNTAVLEDFSLQSSVKYPSSNSPTITNNIRLQNSSKNCPVNDYSVQKYHHDDTHSTIVISSDDEGTDEQFTFHKSKEYLESSNGPSMDLSALNRNLGVIYKKENNKKSAILLTDENTDEREVTYDHQSITASYESQNEDSEFESFLPMILGEPEGRGFNEIEGQSSNESFSDDSNQSDTDETIKSHADWSNDHIKCDIEMASTSGMNDTNSLGTFVNNRSLNDSLLEEIPIRSKGGEGIQGESCENNFLQSEVQHTDLQKTSEPCPRDHSLSSHNEEFAKEIGKFQEEVDCESRRSIEGTSRYLQRNEVTINPVNLDSDSDCNDMNSYLEDLIQGSSSSSCADNDENEMLDDIDSYKMLCQECLIDYTENRDSIDGLIIPIQGYPNLNNEDSCDIWDQEEFNNENTCHEKEEVDNNNSTNTMEEQIIETASGYTNFENKAAVSRNSEHSRQQTAETTSNQETEVIAPECFALEEVFSEIVEQPEVNAQDSLSVQKVGIAAALEIECSNFSVLKSLQADSSIDSLTVNVSRNRERHAKSSIRVVSIANCTTPYRIITFMGNSDLNRSSIELEHSYSIKLPYPGVCCEKEVVTDEITKDHPITNDENLYRDDYNSIESEEESSSHSFGSRYCGIYTRNIRKSSMFDKLYSGYTTLDEPFRKMALCTEENGCESLEHRKENSYIRQPNFEVVPTMTHHHLTQLSETNITVSTTSTLVKKAEYLCYENDENANISAKEEIEGNKQVIDTIPSDHQKTDAASSSSEMLKKKMDSPQSIDPAPKKPTRKKSKPRMNKALLSLQLDAKNFQNMFDLKREREQSREQQNIELTSHMKSDIKRNIEVIDSCRITEVPLMRLVCTDVGNYISSKDITGSEICENVSVRPPSEPITERRITRNEMRLQKEKNKMQVKQVSEQVRYSENPVKTSVNSRRRRTTAFEKTERSSCSRTHTFETEEMRDDNSLLIFNKTVDDAVSRRQTRNNIAKLRMLLESKENNIEKKVTVNDILEAEQKPGFVKLPKKPLKRLVALSAAKQASIKRVKPVLDGERIDELKYAKPKKKSEITKTVRNTKQVKLPKNPTERLGGSKAMVKGRIQKVKPSFTEENSKELEVTKPKKSRKRSKNTDIAKITIKKKRKN